jgi:spermidine synthase
MKKDFMLKLVCFYLGLAGLVLQVVIFREVLLFSQGNELVLGTVLFAWLLGGALGSFWASQVSEERESSFFSISFLATTLLAPLSLLVTRGLGNLIVNPTQMVSFPLLLLLSFIVLVPVNTAFDATLILALHQLGSQRSRELSQAAGTAYFLESIGAFVGALLFTFVLAYLWHSWEIVLAITALFALIGFFLFKQVKPLLLAILVATMGSLFFANQINLATLKWHFNSPIVTTKDTPYQNITLTQAKGQTNFYLNGQVAFVSGIHQKNEEVAHFALLSHPSPEKVLLIGGAVNGSLPELLKHPVKEVTCLELDPALIELGKKYLPKEEAAQPLQDPRVKTVLADARLYLKNTSETYDVIICNLPDPRNTLLNRYYTKDFFQVVRECLRKNGLFSLNLTSSTEYLGKELLQYNGSIFKTLQEVFPYLIALPGETIFFLASVEPHQIDQEVWGKRVKERDLKLAYLNTAYLSYRLERAQGFQPAYPKDLPVNTDLRPTAIYYESLVWEVKTTPWFKNFRQWVFEKRLPIINIFLLILVLYLIKRRLQPDLTLLIATMGLAGLVYELIVTLAYQSFRGYLYSQVGLIIAFFMLGLALGSQSAMRSRSPLFYLKSMGLLLALLLFVTPSIFNLLQKMPWLPFFLLLTGLFAFPIGASYPLSLTILKEKKAAGRLYAADTLGGSLGALLGSAFLLPLGGIEATLYILSGIFLITFIPLILRKSVR